MELEYVKNRREALKFIAQSSIYGNLGLFIGAGFSMALMNEEDHRPVALSWLGLISKVSKKYSIKAEDYLRNGQSLPELVSLIIHTISEKKKRSFDDVAIEFKRHIASLTTYYPKEDIRNLYGRYILNLNPSWIITTNYDLVLEALLPGKCVPLSPSEQLSAPKEIIPIYHLHGIKTIPSSIVITQEDYISLFRPNEYRHTKLPLTIKESTTVVLGYGLNDINVLTAVDWSKNVFKSTKINYPHEIFQILYKDEGYKIKPYRNKDGIIIIEVESLESFFNELMFDLDLEVRSNQKLKSDLREINEAISKPTKKDIEKFINNPTYRRELFDVLVQYESYTISGFIEIFSKSLEQSWQSSRGNKAFYAYDQILEIILDMVINIPLEKMSPILLEMIASNFYSVCPYIGDHYGESWDAFEIWKKSKNDIPKDTLIELFHIANNQKYYSLTNFLRAHFEEEFTLFS